MTVICKHMIASQTFNRDIFQAIKTTGTFVPVVFTSTKDYYGTFTAYNS